MSLYVTVQVFPANLGNDEDWEFGWQVIKDSFDVGHCTSTGPRRGAQKSLFM
jgi:hypothetical protein